MGERSSELENTKLENTGLTKPKYVENDDLVTVYSKGEKTVESPSDDAVQIREKIEETRSQMSETIDAIQDKLSISNITEQVKDQVSEQLGSAVEGAKNAFFGGATDIINSVGRSFRQAGRSNLARKAQEQPWLLPVVGIGIGAILVRAFGGGGDKREEHKSYRYKDFEGGYNPDEIEHSKRSRRKFKSDDVESGYLRNKVGEAAETVYTGATDAAGSAYQGIGEAANKTYRGIGKVSGLAYEKAGDIGEEMKKNYEHYIEKNPLVVGAAAFAVGAAVGYAIPLTKTENNYLGEMRDNVLDKAQASAQEAIGTVKQVVGDVQQTIVDEVKSKTAA